MLRSRCRTWISAMAKQQELWRPRFIPLPTTLFGSLTTSAYAENVADLPDQPLFTIDPKTLTRRLKTSLQEKDADQTWRTLQKLKRAGVDFPEKPLVGESLSLFASGDALCLLRAHKVLSRLNKEDKLDCVDGEILGSLSMAYAKAAMFDLSAHSFRLMLQKHHYPHLSFWKALLEVWVQNARGAIYAVKVFFEICRYCTNTASKIEDNIILVKPDIDAFIVALRACATLGEAEKAEEIIEKMSRFAISPNNMAFCLLMKAYEKGGKMEHLKKVLARMKLAKKVPDQATLNSLLTSCINIGEIDVAAEVVLSWNGNTVDASQYNDEALLTSERSHYEIHDSLRKWKGNLEPPSSETYTLLLKGFLRKNRAADAAKFLAKLYLTKNSEYISCGLALDGALKLGLRDEISSMLEALAVQNTPADSTSYGMLVKAYCKLPHPVKAEAVLHDACRVGHLMDVGFYAAVIDAYNLLQDYDSVQRVFRDMKQKGVSPLEPILDKTLSFFEKQNKPYMMFKLLNTAARNPPLKMELQHWNRTIQTFCKGKLLFDAKAAVKQMKQLGFDADANTYVFLLSGYILMGNKTNEILLLWAEIKDNLAPVNGSAPLQLTEELLNGFLAIFIKYGYFKNALDVVAKMEERNFWADKQKYKNMYWHLHRDLYTSKHRSQRRVDMSQERRKHVDAFKSWVGLPT